MTADRNGSAGGAPSAVALPGHWIDWRERHDRPLWSADLWPNRSLDTSGQRRVLLFVAIGLSIPILPALGTPVVWGLLPFVGIAWAALWFSFRRSNSDLGRLSETVRVWPDEMRVERSEPSGTVLRWQADPWNVRVRVHDRARLESYLTLTGGGREIELGAFLSPSERQDLAEELEGALTKAIRSAPG